MALSLLMSQTTKTYKQLSLIKYMREYLYYTKSAVTAGNLIKDNLMKAGRMDIVCNVIIQALFISNKIRKDAILHLIFDGPPYGNRHLIFDTTKDGGKMPISKKDVAGLIKRMLYKCPSEKGSVLKVFPCCYIEFESFEKVIKKLDREGKNVFLLDGKGEDIRNLKFKGNEVFIVGDQDGFPQDKKKFLKQIEKVSVGPKILFASQVITIINNEVDRKL